MRSKAAIHLAEETMLLAQKGLALYEADGWPMFAQEENNQLIDVFDRAKKQLAAKDM